MKKLLSRQIRDCSIQRSFECLVLIGVLSAGSVMAQINTGSDGHDGALTPTTNLVIDMADHPDGIYHYTSVNIPAGVTVSFISNAKNTPVTWLIKGSCNIAGKVLLDGVDSARLPLGSAGGPGGHAGGNGNRGGAVAGPGMGPGGGDAEASKAGGNGSFGDSGGSSGLQARAGSPYGNQFLLPLLGGSGGGGGVESGGAGGGGAILIAASENLILTGRISARGGYSAYTGEITEVGLAGSGSGGSVRLVAKEVSGDGYVDTIGGGGNRGVGPRGGYGRIRIDAFNDRFTGSTAGVTTRGFQPILIAPSIDAVALSIENIGGILVPANPTGVLSNPDVVIPSQQVNPILVLVRCKGIALKTEITVEVRPSAGAIVRAVGLNDVGTQESSSATVSVNMPRGGGTILAKAVTGLAGVKGAGLRSKDTNQSLAQTGWTIHGEQFAAVEVTATIGAVQQIAYLTESGKRYPLQTTN